MSDTLPIAMHIPLSTLKTAQRSLVCLLVALLFTHGCLHRHWLTVEPGIEVFPSPDSVPPAIHSAWVGASREAMLATYSSNLELSPVVSTHRLDILAVIQVRDQQHPWRNSVPVAPESPAQLQAAKNEGYPTCEWTIHYQGDTVERIEAAGSGCHSSCRGGTFVGHPKLGVSGPFGWTLRTRSRENRPDRMMIFPESQSMGIHRWYVAVTPAVASTATKAGWDDEAAVGSCSDPFGLDYVVTADTGEALPLSASRLKCARSRR